SLTCLTLLLPGLSSPSAQSLCGSRRVRAVVDLLLCVRHVQPVRAFLQRLKSLMRHLPFTRQRGGTFRATSAVEDWSVQVRASQGSRWTFPVLATDSHGGRYSAPRSRSWRKKSSSSCISCSGLKASSRRGRGASSTVAS